MIVRLALNAMATRFEVVLAGAGESKLRAVGEAALAEIEDTAQRLSAFDRGSLLSLINDRAARHAVSVDDDLLDLLTDCARVTRQTDGAFDITVGPLMRDWGFRDRTPTDRAARERPPVGMDDVELDAAARTVRFRRPGMSIDLGGVGKGEGLDAAARVVREHGVPLALLHGGTSTVVAIGAPDGERGWSVALAGTEPALAVTLRDASLSVSAPHGRTVDVGSGQVGHVIDPIRGAPATGVRLAAVVGPRARTTDAWSTALVVLGRRPPSIPAELTTLIVYDDGRSERGGAAPELFAGPDHHRGDDEP
jgi:thiamine biosynthesis lipoprotein